MAGSIAAAMAAMVAASKSALDLPGEAVPGAWAVGARVRLVSPASLGVTVAAAGNTDLLYQCRDPARSSFAQLNRFRWDAVSEALVGQVGVVVEPALAARAVLHVPWLTVVRPDVTPAECWYLPPQLLVAEGVGGVGAGGCTCPAWELFARGCACGQMARERAAVAGGVG